MARHTQTTTTKPNKVKRGAKCAILGFLALLNLLLYTIIIALASHLFDSWIDGKGLTSLLFNARRPAFVALLMFSLLAGAVGFAASIYGLLHAGAWNEYARSSNMAIQMVSLALTILAAGFAIKVERADTGSMNKWPVELRTLGAFDIMAALISIFYVLALGLTKHDRHTVNNNTTTYDNTNAVNAPGVHNNNGYAQTGKTLGHNDPHQQVAMHA